MIGQQKRLDRTFIVLGGTQYGKSALCNILYGERRFPLSIKPKFRCNNGDNPFTMTKRVQREVSFIKEANITLYKDSVKKYLFDIYDNSGIGDPQDTLEVQANNLLKSYSNSTTSSSIVFLIVVSLTGSDFYEEYLTEVSSIVKLMEEQSCKMLSKAIVVLTQRDSYMDKAKIYKERQLQEMFMKDIETPAWRDLKYLLDQVQNRKIFLNATNYNERNNFIEKLFNMTKPTLNIILHGYALFPSAQFRAKIENYETESYKAKINFKIVDDFDSISTSEELSKLDSLSEKIDSIRNNSDKFLALIILIDLISLQRLINDDGSLENFLHKISQYYMKDQSRHYDWKNNSVLVFRIPGWYSRSDVNEIVKKKQLLRNIVAQTKYCYILESENTSDRVLANNLIDKCLDLKYDRSVMKSGNIQNNNLIPNIVKNFDESKNWVSLLLIIISMLFVLGFYFIVL